MGVVGVWYLRRWVGRGCWGRMVVLSVVLMSRIARGFSVCCVVGRLSPWLRPA